MIRVPYALAILSIMYAMMCTRLDVSYALNMVSKLQGNPGRAHWILVMNILNYMQRAKDMFLLLGGINMLGVNGYNDTNFQTDQENFCLQPG